jgi:branched-chain amino acid transport system permease protein
MDAPRRRSSSLRAFVTIAALLGGFVLCVLIERFEWLDPYLQLVLVYLGINVILAASLNLVNGYMGEFSVGHAGFMAIGAYVASVLTVRVFPATWPLALVFPAAVAAGGAAAALAGFVVAGPSFRTRGDYLAIVTLAFSMIVKSVLENVEAVGGPRGYMGMERLTTLPWVFVWGVVTLLVLRNFIYSKYGRGMAAIRDDELAGTLGTVRTRRVKVIAFVVSSCFAGVAGGLYAHVLQFINPRMFDIVKSTDILVMVYLGGTASLGGSIIGAGVFTILMEVLRPLGVWRMVLMPLLLVLLMLFRPRGIMGYHEFRWFVPERDRSRPAQREERAPPHAPA